MLIEDKEIISYQLLLKQDRVLVNQSTCFFDQWNWNFFFIITFRKKWVGRAMGNETFYWDGLMVIKFVTPARVLPFSVLCSLSFFFDFPRSRMRVNSLSFHILGPGWFHSTDHLPLSGHFFDATYYVAYIETFRPFPYMGSILHVSLTYNECALYVG